MALSEPDPPAYDPKAHLQPPLEDVDVDRAGSYNTLPPKQSSEESAFGSTAHLNETAHQLNSTASVQDAVEPPTNGIHSHSGPLEEDATPKLADPIPPDVSDAPATQNHLPPKPDIIPEAPAAPLPEPDVLQSTPAVPQQPISDMRHADEPGSNQKSIEGSGPNDQENSIKADQTPADTESSLKHDVEPSDLISSNATSEPISTNATTEPQAPANLANTEEPQNGSQPAIATSEGSALPPVTDPIDPTASPKGDSNAIPSRMDPDIQDRQNGPDEVMEDAPGPVKTTRAREEDESQDAPAAKRAKTEEDGLGEGFKVPDRPQIDTQMNTQPDSTTTSEPRPMTKPRHKHLVKTVSNVKRINAARPFLAPVDPVALNIPTYLDVIKTPMDLKTLEDNLRAEKYPTVDALEADFNLIVQNSLQFNGPAHVVTKNALAMQENFLRGLTSLPSADTPDTATKKKAPDPMAIRATPARRESRSSVPGSARSPASATSPQTFALGPEGVPLIRRDSTIDGRPKREIHRPAPKDLPYTNQKPKKKKFQWELKFCDHVLKELVKPKYQQFSLPFLNPVDPVALNIPNYLSIIKKPMDFGTMRQRLERGEYENAKEFETDARLVFKNCYLFNPENDPVNTMGKKLESIFNEEWSKKREWLDENVPSSGQRSPASSDDEVSEEEEEEDEEEEDEGQMEIVSKLQKQIAEMSKQVEMITSGAKKKSPPTANKKAKPTKAVKKEPKKAAPVQPKTEKKAAPKPAKKEKVPYVTYEQKTEISSRISELSASKMTQALAIIRSNMPDLSEANDDELELDIDAIPNDVLHKLLIFVRRNAPKADDPPLPSTKSASSAAPARKKNKPMSKHEQEARIAQVQSGLSAFQKGGAANSSTDIRPSIENQSEEEDDEDSESEEE